MDSNFIVISATQSATTSEAFDLSGECKLIADSLVDSECVTLLEERPNGDYEPAHNKSGTGVVLSSKQPSVIVVGYGSYKLQKTVTDGSVAVAVVS